MRRLCPMMLAVLLVLPALSQADPIEDAAAVADVSIGGHFLEGSERSAYNDARCEIDERAASLNSEADCEPAIKDLLGMVERLSVHELVRWDLTRTIATAIFSNADDSLLLVQDLLSDSDERLQATAIDALYEHEELREQPDVTAQLSRLAQDPTQAEFLRVNALWLLKLANEETRARSIASSIIAADDDTLLAHAAATLVVDSFIDDEDVLREAFQQGPHVLREEAAKALASWTDCNLNSELVPFLLDVAKDASESPIYRGEAIEAIGHGAKCRVNHDALVELTSTRWWFFGAAGHHWEIHSLALVVDGLASTRSPADREFLESLRPVLRKLPPEDGGYVEWRLNCAVNECRPSER